MLWQTDVCLNTILSLLYHLPQTLLMGSGIVGYDDLYTIYPPHRNFSVIFVSVRPSPGAFQQALRASQLSLKAHSVGSEVFLAHSEALSGSQQALRPSALALRASLLALRPSQLALRPSQMVLKPFQLTLRPSRLALRLQGLPSWLQFGVQRPPNRLDRLTN